MTQENKWLQDQIQWATEEIRDILSSPSNLDTPRRVIALLHFMIILLMPVNEAYRYIENLIPEVTRLLQKFEDELNEEGEVEAVISLKHIETILADIHSDGGDVH